MKEAKLALAVGVVALALSPAAQSIEKPREPRKPRTPEQVRTTTTTPTTPTVKEAGTGGDARAPSPRPTSLPARTSPSTVPEGIAAAWPGDDSKALRVTGCESKYKPTAMGPTARDGSNYQGLFQFDAQTYRSVGGIWPAANDSVEEQTRRAWKLKQRRGWAPWPVCGKA